MKGAMEAISVVLVTGVLIGVVGSIYFWGLPLIEKNKDISILENSEFFIKNLNDEIKNIANSGGIVNKKITVPATVSFDAKNFRTGNIFSSYIVRHIYIQRNNQENPKSLRRVI